MKNNFFCNKSYINIFETPSNNSKISSQVLYGEEFKILKREKYFLKIRTIYDNYIGYIKKRKFKKKINSSHKVKVLKTKINKSDNYLPFLSKIEILDRKKNYVMFEKNKWIKNTDICTINKKEKNFSNIFKLFLNCKYKWGGKTYKGIDCSALVQLYYKYNRHFFPRDTVDQIKEKNGLVKKKNYKKGDIIFWKGHVAVCISNKDLIHAYGPKKKVIVMPINETIERIKKTANLKVKKVFRI